MSALSPDDQRELAAYFSGALAADMGMRSSLGPQLDRLAAGITAEGNTLVDVTPSERACEAVVSMRRIERTLSSIPQDHAQTLRAYYSPLPLGTLDGLDVFGPYAGIALESHTRADLRAMIKASKRATTDPQGRQARSAIYALVGAATGLLRSAQASYAYASQAARSERRRSA